MYDIIAACVPIFLFAAIAIACVLTTDPEEDTKFEDINK